MSGDVYPIANSPEMLPSEELIKFLQGKFADAYSAQGSEDSRGEFTPNGSFVRSNPLPNEDEPDTTRRTVRIILKPPHPRDLPGTFCKVFAYDTTPAIHDDDNEAFAMPGTDARVFLLQDHTNGRPGPIWTIEEFGVEDLGSIVSDLSEMLGGIEEEPGKLDTSTKSRTLPLIGVDPVPQSGNPMEVAKAMLDKYKHYNIVPSVD